MSLNHATYCNQISNKVGKSEEKSNSIHPLSENEIPVSLLDSNLEQWIKVIRPSRASLIYVPME